MAWYWILLIVLAGSFIFLFYIPCFVIAPIFVAKGIHTRSKPSKWSKDGPSSTKDEDMVYMWNESLKFRDSHKDEFKEVRVTTSDNLHLYGEFYPNKMKDKAVIVICGRPETLIYSLYYAIPYYEYGYSVLVFDPRAHGDSEGKTSGMGYQEKEDIKAFAEYLNKKEGINHIVIHGVCLGASAATFVARNDTCPSYIKGLVTDGVFPNYQQALIRRLRVNSHMNPYPMLPAFRRYAKKLYNYDIVHQGALDNFRHTSIPVLMFNSKEDIFTLVEQSKQLYNELTSKQKKLVLFEHGRHSHLRSTDPALYDKSIKEFLTKLD